MKWFCMCVNVYFKISFPLLKLAGLCCTCTYVEKHGLPHVSLPVLLNLKKGHLSLKKACMVKSIYSIRFLTSLFTLHLTFSLVFFVFVFVFLHDQWSWKNANQSLMDRTEQPKRGAWPPCPSPLSLPRLFEQSVSDQDQLSGPNGGNSVRGGSYLWCRAR